jgi:hypothetical protein
MDHLEEGMLAVGPRFPEVDLANRVVDFDTV